MEMQFFREVASGFLAEGAWRVDSKYGSRHADKSAAGHAG